MEISGDVLADMGYEAYRFRSGLGVGVDIWRTEVYDARWTSERALAFKLKRIHLTSKGGSAKPTISEETEPENWALDLDSKKIFKS